MNRGCRPSVCPGVVSMCAVWGQWYLAVDLVGQALQGLVGGLILLKGCLHILSLEIIV